MDQLLHEKLQPLEAEIKSMMKQIASKCLSGLVRGWQASQSKICAVGERPATEPEIVHNYGDPHTSTDAQKSFFPAENILIDIQQGCIFGSSNLCAFDGHLMIQATDDIYSDFTQTGDWIHTVAPEPQLMEEALGFQRATKLPSFVCFSDSPHPEPKTNSGKGKGRENVSVESQNVQFCLDCFPMTQSYAPRDELGKV